MKKILSKKLNVLEIVLLLSPVIDIATAISQRTFNIDLSLGLIIRSFLLFFISMFMIVKSNYRYKKLTVIYFVFILMYFSIFIINTYFNKGNAFVIPETKELIKAFYFPICIIAILNYLETRNDKIDSKVLFIVILEYIILLFIPSILNIGYESYAEDKIGTIGWFYSANEISAIYSILIVLIIYSYKYIKNIVVYLCIIVLGLYTILQIGTKLPAVAAIISIISYTIVKLWQFIINKEKKYLYSMYIGVLVGLIFVFLFINSPVLKNFDIYKNYLLKTRETQLVELSEINDNNQNESTKNDKDVIELKGELSEDIVTEGEKNEKFLSTENETLTENEIATIIHSGRMETQEKINNTFNKLSISNKLIGLGYMNTNDNSYYLIEIDYFDILFNYGYIGFLIYFLPIIFMLMLICKRGFSKGIKQIISNDYICCFSIITINGLLCAIAGHTFVAPAVSIYLSIGLIQLYKKLE